MRLCRFESKQSEQLGFFDDATVIPLSAAAANLGVSFAASKDVLAALPGGNQRQVVRDIQQRLGQLPASDLAALRVPVESVRLLVPVPAPSKLLLLAGNYSKHIEEGGGKATERAQTFPYVFMKPPLTTLTHPGDPVRIPEVSPDHIDWELELGVVIGRKCKNVKEAEALDYVAGYTVVNDISDRKFRPNSTRTQREKDSFFDWQHGKWHDTFCPMGPCILPADEQPNPQTLRMTLKVNGQVEQDGSTSEMIFPVAAIIEFISNFVTLVPGDIISTGTTSGVGHSKGKYLKAGDKMEAWIEKIGTLRSPVV
ncbi:MAG: fumarylacetoacetate hydrolase family protein [Planctomycetota bacterium]